MKLICIDCGKEFEFTEGEQKFFNLKGFAQPKRCYRCRQIKKRKLNLLDDKVECNQKDYKVWEGRSRHEPEVK